MAAIKSLVSLISRATLLFALVGLVVVQTEAQTCTSQLGNINVCAPFVLPGAANTNPSPECCTALQAVDHDCLCSTIRIASRLPSQCHLPPLSSCNGSNYFSISLSHQVSSTFTYYSFRTMMITKYLENKYWTYVDPILIYTIDHNLNKSSLCYFSRYFSKDIVLLGNLKY